VFLEGIAPSGSSGSSGSKGILFSKACGLPVFVKRKTKILIKIRSDKVTGTKTPFQYVASISADAIFY
jgi:hypothetical protein